MSVVLRARSNPIGIRLSLVSLIFAVFSDLYIGSAI